MGIVYELRGRSSSLGLMAVVSVMPPGYGQAVFKEFKDAGREE